MINGGEEESKGFLGVKNGWEVSGKGDGARWEGESPAKGAKIRAKHAGRIPKSGIPDSPPPTRYRLR